MVEKIEMKTKEKSLKYETLSEEKFLEESIKFFKNIAQKFKKEEIIEKLAA